MITDIFDHPSVTREQGRQIARQWQLLIDRPPRSAVFEMDYAFGLDGAVRMVIDVPKGPRAPARRQLATLRRAISAAPSVGTLLRAVRRARIDPGQMHLVMVTWLADSQAAPDYRNLGQAFLERGLGLDLAPGELALFEQTAIQPILTPQATATWARRHMDARHAEQMLKSTVPPAMLLLASLTPVGRAGTIAYISWNALIGFVDYLYTVYSAEADGTITDKEENDAFWALVGMFPFRLVELVTTARMAIVLGQAFVEVALAALDELSDRIALLMQARDAGWDSAVALDASHSVFVPAYALADIRPADAP